MWSCSFRCSKLSWKSITEKCHFCLVWWTHISFTFVSSCIWKNDCYAFNAQQRCIWEELAPTLYLLAYISWWETIPLTNSFKERKHQKTMICSLCARTTPCYCCTTRGENWCPVRLCRFYFLAIKLKPSHLMVSRQGRSSLASAQKINFHADHTLKPCNKGMCCTFWLPTLFLQ